MQPPRTFATPAYQSLLEQCIHCGLCLPACPTYSVLHTEMDSPRGRIQLMQAAAQGRIDLDGAFEEHISLCLGCRACETACPSGVQYGALLETARATLEEQRAIGVVAQWVRRLTLRELLPHRDRLRLIARVLQLAQASGLTGLANRSGLLPPQLRTMEELLPPLSTDYPDYSRPAPAWGPRRGTVAFFIGCVQDAFLTRVNAATVRVLQRNGYEVHFPAQQTCCGAAALHVGEVQLAQTLARQNIAAFAATDYTAIINNAGGCGASLKEVGHLLRDDPQAAAQADAFSKRVQDISEFLAANLHVAPRGPINARVVYADSCHLRHAQRVVHQPRELLRRIPGVELVELSRPDLCCGSAGTYNILHAETAQQILDLKLDDIRAARPDLLVTTNTGCHMQYLHGVKQAGLKLPVLHLVELLDRAYECE